MNLYHYSKRHIKSIDFFECLFCFLSGHIHATQTKMPRPDPHSPHRTRPGTFPIIFGARISAHVTSYYILSQIPSGSSTLFVSGFYSSGRISPQLSFHLFFQALQLTHRNFICCPCLRLSLRQLFHIIPALDPSQDTHMLSHFKP